MHSEKALQWFERSGEEQFFFCRFTQLTVLRLLTTENVMEKDVRNMAQAWVLWDKVWADARIAFLPEPDGLEPEFRLQSRFRADPQRFGQTRTCSPLRLSPACGL